MPPTEQKILTNFLLPPAPLPTIITLQSFIALFPRSQQSSPHIRTLYRDLQHQRAQLADSVTAEIEREARRGKAIERAVARGRRQDERVVQDDEVDVERAVSLALLLYFSLYSYFNLLLSPFPQTILIYTSSYTAKRRTSRHPTRTPFTRSSPPSVLQLKTWKMRYTDSSLKPRN